MIFTCPESEDSEPTESQREEAIKSLNDVTARFSEAAANRNLSDKERLKKTMQAISEAYRALQLQSVALGQSPSHGIALLGRLRSLFPSVPVVFYSRKITPEDVIAVLQAGAVDAIRKGTLKPQELLARLKLAQSREYPANPLIR